MGELIAYMVGPNAPNELQTAVNAYLLGGCVHRRLDYSSNLIAVPIIAIISLCGKILARNLTSFAYAPGTT